MTLKSSSSSKKNKKHKLDINKFNNPGILNDSSNNDCPNGDTLENIPIKTQESKDEIAMCVRAQGDGQSFDKSIEVVESLSPNTFMNPPKRFRINVELDIIAIGLTILALCTRFYRLEEPPNIVFDELHFGKYVGMYVKKIFFFDLHPPLGKLLISGVAYLAGFDGKFKFDKIGSAYSEDVPIFALRSVSALCGSLIIPSAYYLMLELGCSQCTAALAAFLLLCDNALLTQSRFILLEPILIFFMLTGLTFLLKFLKVHNAIKSTQWWLSIATSFALLTSALCVKYVGVFTFMLGICLICYEYWEMLPDKSMSDKALVIHALSRSAVVLAISLCVYLSVFYVHLFILTKAGPHDSVMTSAFQASLEGGLASITKGQPLEVAHGSQVTLRHTHGKTCWLHSHSEVYPVRYPDKRGSSHQQQVTCYTFKDLNNWWIIRRPDVKNLVVSNPPDAIKHGDVIHFVHGITGRPLNSHDVSAPMSPHNQEVSCYIDYNISMPPLTLWKVDIVNRDQEGDIWHTIQSQVRLIHLNSSQALKFSGRQLPDWGFHQLEVVTDKTIVQDDTVWNVEEHRYTKIEDEKEREKDLMNAEMIPMKTTKLSFWTKFSELQYKMMFPSQDSLQNHMYSSEPLEWPLMTRGIAYWVSPYHNGQVHLLGNIVIWYSGTLSLLIYSSLLIFYLLRRTRLCFDITEAQWIHFLRVGHLLFSGYLLHFIPYFFVERTLFLHHYLPAFVFKVLLTAAIVEHIYSLLRYRKFLKKLYLLLLILWICSIILVFKKFSVLCYGMTELSAEDVIKLRWSESWDFIIHKE
ncbi:unnamed protein product [Nezara viridula]|uniref:Protein O-mannosyltransferase 1 n=1 Tax=Nezara viridula TaxID=85310 RepID=A0A9P0H2W9_NEZVI|nr:unnamed protein product [Nezara viridula]